MITDGVNGFLFDAGNSVQATEVLFHAMTLSPDTLSNIGEEAFRTVTQRFTDRHEADIFEPALTDLMKEI